MSHARISAFLFVRAYHRALDKNMTIEELAKSLGTSVQYIRGKRQYLTTLLRVKFPQLAKPGDKKEDKDALRRMVVDCHKVVRRKRRHSGLHNAQN